MIHSSIRPFKGSLANYGPLDHRRNRGLNSNLHAVAVIVTAAIQDGFSPTEYQVRLLHYFEEYLLDLKF